MEPETRVRLTLTGTLELQVPGGEARLTRLEVRADGSFREPSAFEIELGGPLAEVRKLALLHEGLHALLAHAADEPADRDASVTLVATPRQRERLASAAAGLGDDLDANALIASEAWMAALLALADYEPRAITVDRPG